MLGSIPGIDRHFVTIESDPQSDKALHTEQSTVNVYLLAKTDTDSPQIVEPKTSRTFCLPFEERTTQCRSKAYL